MGGKGGGGEDSLFVFRPSYSLLGAVYKWWQTFFDIFDPSSAVSQNAAFPHYLSSHCHMCSGGLTMLPVCPMTNEGPIKDPSEVQYGLLRLWKREDEKYTGRNFYLYCVFFTLKTIKNIYHMFFNWPYEILDMSWPPLTPINNWFLTQSTISQCHVISAFR